MGWGKNHIYAPAMRIWKANEKARIIQTRDLKDITFIKQHIDDGKLTDLTVWKRFVATKHLPKDRVICDYHGQYLTKTQYKELGTKAEKKEARTDYVLVNKRLS